MEPTQDLLKGIKNNELWEDFEQGLTEDSRTTEFELESFVLF